MSEQVNLISQSDVLDLIANYAEKYPINSCDTYTRSIGNLLSSMAIDMIKNVPIKATLSLKGADECL